MFETLTKGFRAARNRLTGLQELTDENIDQALRDVRLSLLEADVELGVVKTFLARVKERAVGQTMQAVAKGKEKTIRLGPAELFVQVCQEELQAMMAFDGEAIAFAPKPNPTGIMMVGLQGSGKTTSAAKLARLLVREHDRKPLLVAADIQRPGAIEQLKVLGQRIDVPVFSIPGGRPTDICVKGLAEAKRLKCDVVIFDTAGRLAIDEPLMQELVDIKSKVKPDNVFFVVDGMIGQDAVKTAKSFHDRLDLSGVILTKLDGDARGGAALSVKQVTGAAVKFVGMGEELERMEQFRPEGMASRILGMGDVVGLLKDFEGVVDEKKAEQDAKRMLEGRFTLDDFLQQIEMIQNMGPLKDLLEKLPMFGDMMPEGMNVDDGELVRVKSMVSSMTKQERRQPELFQKQPKRVERVAKGSGHQPQEIGDLLQRFMFMRQMMGDIGQSAGMLSRIPGMKQLASARKMTDLVRAGGAGLDGNPMMQNLASQLLEAAVAGDGKMPAGMPKGFPGMPGGFPGMPGGFPGMPGGFPGMPGGFPGMPGGFPGFGAPPSAVRKKVDKDAKKKERKKQKEARRKSRK